MNQKYSDIAELAELIAEENILQGRVDLERITRRKRITMSYGNYGNYFLGELEHLAGRFHIYINLNLLKDRRQPRTRFTVGHELGHFFIDEHRNQLKQGKSLSYAPDFNYFSNIAVEKEANHFSSNLLMPARRFINQIRHFEPGLEGILRIRDQFLTSIECTSIRYITLDLMPALLIKWKSDLSFQYPFYSNSFSKLTGIKGRPSIMLKQAHLREVFQAIDSTVPKPDFIEEVSRLSNWLATITPNSKWDHTVLEQTMKLGSFGAITLLLIVE